MINIGRSCRDQAHFEWVMGKIQKHLCRSMLDIGTWDGWLPELCNRHTQHELITYGIESDSGLCAQARDKGIRMLNYTLTDRLPLNAEERIDLIAANEVLEHIDFKNVPGIIKDMDRAGRVCLVSLPDQRHEDNREHLWTPTEEVIGKLFGQFNLEVIRVEYAADTGIPPNWLISWTK